MRLISLLNALNCEPRVELSDNVYLLVFLLDHVDMGVLCIEGPFGKRTEQQHILVTLYCCCSP